MPKEIMAYLGFSSVKYAIFSKGYQMISVMATVFTERAQHFETEQCIENEPLSRQNSFWHPETQQGASLSDLNNLEMPVSQLLSAAH